MPKTGWLYRLYSSSSASASPSDTREVSSASVGGKESTGDPFVADNGAAPLYLGYARGPASVLGLFLPRGPYTVHLAAKPTPP